MFLFPFFFYWSIIALQNFSPINLKLIYLVQSFLIWMNTIYLTSLLLLIKIYLSFQEIWTFFHVSWLNLILIVLSQECLEYLAFWPLGYSSKLLPWDLLNHCSFKGPSKSATTIENLIVLFHRKLVPTQPKPPRKQRKGLQLHSHTYLQVWQRITGYNWLLNKILVLITRKKMVMDVN